MTGLSESFKRFERDEEHAWTTSAPASTEVADKANLCIAMVMANALRERETLMYDHLHRRSKRSEGLRTYPENVLHVYEEFTHRIIESSAAKVEVIYGEPRKSMYFK